MEWKHQHWTLPRIHRRRHACAIVMNPMTTCSTLSVRFAQQDRRFPAQPSRQHPDGRQVRRPRSFGPRAVLLASAEAHQQRSQEGVLAHRGVCGAMTLDASRHCWPTGGIAVVTSTCGGSATGRSSIHVAQHRSAIINTHVTSLKCASPRTRAPLPRSQWYALPVEHPAGDAAWLLERWARSRKHFQQLGLEMFRLTRLPWTELVSGM